MMAMAYPNEVSGYNCYAACAACASHFREILLLACDWTKGAKQLAQHCTCQAFNMSHRRTLQVVEIGRDRPRSAKFLRQGLFRPSAQQAPPEDPAKARAARAAKLRNFESSSNF